MKQFEEVEYFTKTYSVWKQSQKIYDTKYKFSNFKNKKLEQNLKKFIKQLSTLSEIPKITTKC